MLLQAMHKSVVGLGWAIFVGSGAKRGKLSQCPNRSLAEDGDRFLEDAHLLGDKSLSSLNQALIGNQFLDS